MGDIFSLPNELLMLLLGHMDGHDVRSFGNTCRRFRSFILSNKLKLPKPELKWYTAQLAFGRRITLVRQRSFLQQRKRKRLSDGNGLEKWEFTEEEFTAKFASLFLTMAPQEMYIKCKDFDQNVEALVKKCVGTLRSSTLALEMDKCSLDECALGDFFKHYSPFSLHLAGHFDRSIISDENLPLSSLFALFIGANRADMETCTRVSGITVRKIVNNWFKRYPDSTKDKPSLPPIDGYLSKTFSIEIPDCDMDYNEFFAFLREIILVPHGTKERIKIGKLPKTLIHTIYSNLTTFNEIGPAVWVEQGLCSVDDIKWCASLTCQCDNRHLADHNYFLDRDLPPSPSQMCDTVQLDLSITVSRYEEMLRPKNYLLNVWITLKSGEVEREKCLPETVLVDTAASHKRRRTRP